MDILNQIIQAIEKGVEWFLSTPLPYDTADAMYKILEYSTTILLPLIKEYIDIIAGVSV